jgi:peptidoglycan/LPS O-acetylase OafA/YrhL
MPPDDRTGNLSDPAPQTSERLLALEGVRGLAALAVVLHHLGIAFWPWLYLKSSTVSTVLAFTPLRFLHDGPFAVRIFFVLSGVALSFAYFRRPSQDLLAEAAIRRYFRLTPPILASVLIVYFFLITGVICPTAYAGVAERIGVEGLLYHAYKFQPRLSDAWWEGVWNVYIEPSRYSSVLWTMTVEFIGSFVVFGFLGLWGRARRRWLLYLVLGFLLYRQSSLNFDFLLGVALCDGFTAAQRRGLSLRIGTLIGTVLLVAGVVLGTAQPGWMNAVPSWMGNHSSKLKPLGAALVLSAALLCPFWRRQFERPSLQWLGRVSFSLYLIHWPLLFAVGGWSLVGLHEVAGWSYWPAVAVLAGLVLVADLLGAWAFYHWVDRPAVQLSRLVSRLFVSPASPKARSESREPMRRAA